MFWCIDWIFVNAQGLFRTDVSVPEEARLGDLLTVHLSDHQDGGECLQYYRAAGITGVRLFLKADGKNCDKYYELDLQQSLKENLKKKTVIEYPMINVVLRDHSDCFELIDSGKF